jgi:hypothetical protein
VVFNRCFPVTEVVKGYAVDSWIFKFESCPFSLPCEGTSVASQFECPKHFITILWPELPALRTT